MCHIFYSTYADASMYQGSSCRGFTLLMQLLKSKNSVQTCFAINNTFASSANMSELLLFTQMIFGLNETLVKQTDSSLLFTLLVKALRDVFPRGSTLSINSPFWESSHIWRYITR